jgi:hypothetical protein
LLIENHFPNQQSTIGNQQLFDLFVRRVLAATVAELFEFQAFRCRFAVLGGRVVPLFAVTTL